VFFAACSAIHLLAGNSPVETGSTNLPPPPGLFNALCFGLTERGDFSLFRSGSV
jgi:hypothetical protein